MERSLLDFALLMLYIFFGYYKAAMIRGSTWLSMSFRIYNIVIASFFFVAIVVLALFDFSREVEQAILMCGRVALIAAILFCILLLEVDRGTRPWVVALRLILIVLGVVVFSLVVHPLTLP